MVPPEPSPADVQPAKTPAPDPARQRYVPRRKSLWQRVPISVRLGVPMALVAIGWFVHEQWQASRAWLLFGNSGQPVPPLQLTVFPDQLAFNAPSPPPALGSMQLDGNDGQGGYEIMFDRTLIASTALVRYSGPGVGTGYTHIGIGRDNHPVKLQPPRTVSGRVVTRGNRAPDQRGDGPPPIAGARIIGLGGGEHGVVLCESISDADGRFVLEGFDAGLPALGIRVLAPGYAVAFTNWDVGQPEPKLSLVVTSPIRGSVQLPEGVLAGPLRVLAKGLPGVQAMVRDDGSFELDHVPPQLQPRLLLYGLLPGFTCRATHAKVGDEDVRLRVLPAVTVRGYVLDQMTQRPLAGALVWQDHGPVGPTVVRTVGDGSFVLGSVPVGEITIAAQHRSTDTAGKSYVCTGSRRLEVKEGLGHDNVIIRVN